MPNGPKRPCAKPQRLAPAKPSTNALLILDLDELLRAVNGRKVMIGNQERTLATLGIEVERIEPDFMTKMLGALANPNVALILMLLGTYGLISVDEHRRPDNERGNTSKAEDAEGRHKSFGGHKGHAEHQKRKPRIIERELAQSVKPKQ
jgi:hypothetical protein